MTVYHEDMRYPSHSWPVRLSMLSLNLSYLSFLLLLSYLSCPPQIHGIAVRSLWIQHSTHDSGGAAALASGAVHTSLGAFG